MPPQEAPVITVAPSSKDGEPLASLVDVANKWLQHFRVEEFAALVPGQDLDWFFTQPPSLDPSVTHDIDIALEDIPAPGAMAASSFTCRRF
eukprot:2959879-Pyramimonas_sp.AAC.1